PMFPFGSAHTPGSLPAGRIAASIQAPFSLRTSTPPAENSRLTGRFVTQPGLRAKELARPAWMPIKSPGTRHPRVPSSVTKYVARRHLDGSTAAGRPPHRRGPRGGGDDDERDRPARHREGEAAA